MTMRFARPRDSELLYHRAGRMNALRNPSLRRKHTRSAERPRSSCRMGGGPGLSSTETQVLWCVRPVRNDWFAAKPARRRWHLLDGSVKGRTIKWKPVGAASRGTDLFKLESDMRIRSAERERLGGEARGPSRRVQCRQASSEGRRWA